MIKGVTSLAEVWIEINVAVLSRAIYAPVTSLAEVWIEIAFAWFQKP